MATSGTRTFSMDFDEIVDQALAIAGGQPSDAHTLRLAKRAFNLLTLDLGNRGVNLWQISSATVTLVAGTATYTLDASVLDVLDVAFRDDDSGADLDVLMQRMSRSEYASIYEKADTGKPVAYYVQRLYDAPTITVWPVPDSDNAEELRVDFYRRTEDVTAFSETLGIPPRFLPAIVQGMAFMLAQVRPDVVDAARRAEIKAEYESTLLRAQQEDRERVPTIVLPDTSGYWR